MEFSPSRTWLYRTLLFAVILLGSWPLAAQGTITQYGRRPSSSKGPRALGLIQLFPNGKAHLIPIAITVDGKFFDAASYKGSPVPMALDFGVVYEGLKTGVSLGTFTITQPGQAGRLWMAEGTWLPAGTKEPQKGMKYETPKIEDKDAPPRLHRGDPKAAEKPPPEPPVPAKPQETAKAMEPPAPIEDPNRPILRRGKPDPATRHELVKKFDDEAKADKDAISRVQVFPAISDAGGPDPRPYKYDLKPAEEAGYRNRMLEMASAELARANAAPPEIPTAKSRKAAGARKLPPISFDNVQLRIFDLTTSNDPVLILSATARPTSEGSTEGQEITLVARTNLDGDLRRLFFSHTDAHHLDVDPRMELIDAVDADGDGRGELLFRRTSDVGSSYAVYRASADQLRPLYEGAP